MERDDFNQKVAEYLRENDHEGAAEWTLQNASDMGGMGPAGVADHEDLPLSEDSFSEVAEAILTGYEIHKECLPEEEA